MKKETVVDLMHALVQRSIWLMTMQMDINNYCPEEAMEAQLEYLYWTDEISRMFPKHGDDLVALVASAMGHRYLEE